MLGAISDNTRSIFSRANPLQNLLEHRLIAKVALHEFDARNGVHGQNVRRHDAALAADDARGVLAPAARGGAQIDHANARPQQPLVFLNLRELEDGARAPALFLRAFHELIVGVFGSQRELLLERLGILPVRL